MNKIKTAGYKALSIVEDIALIIISIATVIAIIFEIGIMIKAMEVTLSDLLLLFIYLEVLAMASIYLKSGRLPVRIPLYIAMVAMARYMILDMKNLDTLRVLGLAGAIFILALTVFVVRYGHTKFPYQDKESS